MAERAASKASYGETSLLSGSGSGGFTPSMIPRSIRIGWCPRRNDLGPQSITATCGIVIGVGDDHLPASIGRWVLEPMGLWSTGCIRVLPSHKDFIIIA